MLAEVSGDHMAKSLKSLCGGKVRRCGNRPAKSLITLIAEAEGKPILRIAPPLGAASVSVVCAGAA